MIERAESAEFLAGEARGLLTRLEAVQPFSLTISTLPAASIPSAGLSVIEEYLATGRRVLHDELRRYLNWILGPGREEGVPEQQRRLTFLRLRFNLVLDQLDIYADALSQRSEPQIGVWLAGLDRIAADALRLREPLFDAPPVITYLDRGHGAAIRRVRTRLPGGGRSPVALIRVPRERMVGGGVGASLVHEVGHQAAALLDLNNSLRSAIERRARAGGARAVVWQRWSRWIGEIVADLWAIGHLGAGGTVGLMSVVSLPRAFMFRMESEDPHPFPWIRVRLNCVLGRMLFPDPQWDWLDGFWQSAFPREGLSEDRSVLLEQLEHTAPQLAELLLGHRARALRGRSLAEILPLEERDVGYLRRRFESWGARSSGLCKARPTLALAVLGQARLDGRISPEREAITLRRLLTQWAVEPTDRTRMAPFECRRPLADWDAA